MIEPQYEDQNRYTAPPDNDPEPKTYDGYQIGLFVMSCLPDGKDHGYQIHEIREYLQTAIAGLEDEFYGIDTL